MRHSPVSAWRQARAILLLPGAVTLVVPTLIVWQTTENIGWDLPLALALVPTVLGLALIGLGVVLVVWTVALLDRG